MNEQKINEAFDEMTTAFNTAFQKSMGNTPQPNFRLNLKNARWRTFWQLQKCAWEILLTNKASIVLKKHQPST